MSAMDKKVKILIEALPRLDEAEARRLLEKAGGSVNKASEMALEGGEWNPTPAKKKPVKKEEKKDTAAPRRDEKKIDRPRREFVERKPEPKVEKKAEIKATPSSIVIGATKSKVESGLSFADMIKRQKQPEPVVEAVPEPVVEVAPVQEEVVTPAAVEEPVAAPVVEAPKPKKEKKEPKKKTVAPLPQKYEAEIDRVAAVNLPTSIAELASNAFTFSSEAGRVPSPPRQVQQQQQQQQQPVHQVHHQQDWTHQRQHQPVQRTWNQENNNYNNNRNQHFSGDWRNNGRGYDNNMGYNTQRMGGYNNQRPDGSAYNMAHQRPAQQVQQVQQPQNFW